MFLGMAGCLSARLKARNRRRGEGRVAWIKPMEPVRRTRVEEKGYWAQVKFDGVRLMAASREGRVILYNRKGCDRTAHYPELQSMKEIAQEFYLDGELIAPDGSGRPDFPTLIRRDLADPQRAAGLAPVIPIQYIPFDVLGWEGQWLLDRPIEERFEYLRNIPASPWVVPAQAWLNGAELLWAEVKQRELEGIVVKREGSPYVPGRASPLWQKVKHRRTLRVWVGGVVIREGQVRSLCIGRKDEQGRLYYIGNVGSGLGALDADVVIQGSRHLWRKDSPFVNQKDLPGGIFWEPEIQADVEYAEWTPEGRLRQPSLKGFVSVH